MPKRWRQELLERTAMAKDSFGARSRIVVDGAEHDYYSLDALSSFQDISRLPFAIKVLLENLLRHEDGVAVTAADVEALAGWGPHLSGRREIMFSPARVLMQDFTGVPAVVDLAAMRDAMAAIGGKPSQINPLVPVDLVIDHSVIADLSGTPDAFSRNAALELSRNRERYELLKWAQSAFEGFSVVPPDTGICHQVNLEYLAQVVFTGSDGLVYPDTVVGTDSHTTMVNGLGVLGWGVGGIEAEAVMLGQPMPMLIPPVVGLELTGELPAGATATDLVLTITELLRSHGVVGKLVEVYGEGISTLPLENRATIGNMSPEYGATCAIFPIDVETLRYLRLTGRDEHQIKLVEAYAKEQGLFHEPSSSAAYSEVVRLDLATVEPSIAGPSRPQDRVPLASAKQAFRASLAKISSSNPKSGPYLEGAATPAPLPPNGSGDSGAASTARQVRDGDVVIAAITSCTNTSNPQVMIAAGLLAEKAVARGLRSKEWVKTSLAPGSKVVTEYLDRAGLTSPLEKLGFNLVGYGCTTCIGNSGPLLDGIAQEVSDRDLAVCAVLSGNRNFEGRIHPSVKMNYLASPPLVVAYALAGTMDIDLATEPLGTASDGQAVYLSDLWPTPAEVIEAARSAIRPEMFAETYSKAFQGDESWAALGVPSGESFSWDEASTYVRKPPFFDSMTIEEPPLAPIHAARVLALLGDSVTTDHISPAGSIPQGGPAGLYLLGKGVARADFNSFGSRRGNHEVMIRGTFANIRLRNLLAPQTEGGWTRHMPSGEVMTIFDAATRYRSEGVPLIVLAGKEYGSGSSRDWAAKGTVLLGVRAVIAQSFERIHRSNLIGMGVLPIELIGGATAASLGLTGEETYDIAGIESLAEGELPETITVLADGNPLPVKLRIDTPREAEYYRNGGILPYVLRQLRS